jgi:predicted MPP superfamily phosphohydrolase
MFSKYFLLLALTITTAESFGADLFKISPYSLKNTNGHMLLNFQLNEDKKLMIEDGVKIINERDYKKDVHYQIELSLVDCGMTKDLRIKDNNEIIFTKNFTQPACASTPAESEYVFGFISDTQQYTQRHEAVAKVIAYHHALEPLQFIINGGDVVQNGQKEEEWIEYFKGGSAYLMDIPQIAAIGNHDYRGQEDKALPKYFQKYMRWVGTPINGNLFFEMPGFQLVIWNSNSAELTSSQETEMWTWLEEKMKAAKNSGTPLILATHFPVFSSSLNRFTSASVRKLKSHLVPLAEKYGIKLILSGHTHMFERSLKDGVNYLVAGPAGGRANSPSMTNKYQQSFDSNALTFTKIKYSNKTLKLETFNQDNALIDQLFINL